MPSSAGEDGTDGLGTVPSVLQKLRTDGRGRSSDGTVDSTDGVTKVAIFSDSQAAI